MEETVRDPDHTAILNLSGSPNDTSGRILNHERDRAMGPSPWIGRNVGHGVGVI
jgi:hypothetical protein